MKRPAINFYTSDFLVGVSNLTMEERGQYITMLCLQHQQGHLSKKTIKLNIGEISQDVLEKFDIDGDGNYYNKRLDEEIEKKNKFLEHQRENGLKGGRPKKAKENPKKNQALTQTKPKEKPLEDENENINDNINKNINKNIYSYIEYLYKRPLTTTEFNKINNLLKEYKEELIRLAIDKSVENGVYKLKYAEVILKNWKDKNLNTISEIEADELLLGVSKNDFYQEDNDYDWLNE